MWTDSLPPGRSWTSLIGDYFLCGCGGLRNFSGPCSVCHSTVDDLRALAEVREHRGLKLQTITVPGAEGRREDYQLLALMQREWERVDEGSADAGWLTDGMSRRATVVILFWTYFESRMSRLAALGLRSLPSRVGEDLLRRHDSVSAHMRGLYKILFGVTYLDDLKAVGAEHIGGHIARVQDARNRFVHGDPNALSDDIVLAVVEKLKESMKPGSQF